MSKNLDCIFCKIINGEIPSNKIYEDEDFIAILDIKPNNLGHALIIPKEHHKNIFDLPDNLLEKLGKKIQLVANGVLKGTDASGINVGMNNGFTAGQLIHHAHLHIIPRFQGDGLIHWQQKEEFTDDDFKAVAEKIRQNIHPVE
ncbi:MAG: HIT family protein [Patescibacteria group bacterium]